MSGQVAPLLLRVKTTRVPSDGLSWATQRPGELCDPLNEQSLILIMKSAIGGSMDTHRAAALFCSRRYRVSQATAPLKHGVSNTLGIGALMSYFAAADLRA